VSARWTLGALLVAAAGLAALTLHGLRASPDATSSAPAAVSAREVDADQPPSLADERPPWEVVRERDTVLPAGAVPVAHVAAPPPDPSTPMPPASVEPPNPATHRPPLHNPGGVDGDRPPRSP